jgi:uncharacterized membrane protein
MIPLHPRIVHFPVALLISAGLFGILALAFKSKRNLFKEVLLWNLALGVIGGVVAIITGLREEANLVHNDTIHSIMETHKLLGFIFSGIFLVLLIWIVIRKSNMKILEFSSIVVFLVLSAGLLGYSAHLGGIMVYENGAGIIPLKEIINNPGSEHEHQNGHDIQDHNIPDTDETKEHDTHDHESHSH